MPKHREAWRVVGSGVALLVILTLLLSTPSMVFAQNVDVLAADLKEQNAQPQRVSARIDFSDLAQLQKIPKKLGNWTLSKEYEYDRVQEILSADVLLSRDYRRPDLLQAVNLLIVQSTNVTSFHPAEVCYRAQGWTLPRAGHDVVVHVENTTWASAHWLSPEERNVFEGNVTVKSIEVLRGNATSPVVEKRVAMFAYLKRENWRVTEEIAWIRVEMSIPEWEDASVAEPILADLLGQAFPALFVVKQGGEKLLIETLILERGVLGGGAALLLLAIPALFFVGRPGSSERRSPLAREVARSPPPEPQRPAKLEPLPRRR